MEIVGFLKAELLKQRVLFSVMRPSFNNIRTSMASTVSES